MRGQRQAEWEREFLRYASNPENIARDGMPHIFDLSVSPDHFDDHNGCLIRADRNQEHRCQKEDCRLVIYEEDGLGIAVQFPCGHTFHLHQVIAHFGALHRTESKNCLAPHCGARPYNLVIRNGFEEPVRKWFEDRNRWYQVGGYIEFRSSNVFASQIEAEFLPFEGEDRWGDLYGEDHPMYRHAREREEAENQDEQEESPPPYEQGDFQHERPDEEVGDQGVEDNADLLQDGDDIF